MKQTLALMAIVLSFPLLSPAQSIRATYENNTPQSYQIKGLPELEETEAFYSYLWIFEDGNFTPKDHFPNHNANIKNLYSSTGNHRVYAYYLDNYTDSGPPPKRIVGDFNNETVSNNRPTTVDYSNKAINIQLFPEHIRPTDPFQVAIISFKNTTTSPFSGQVLLEYNSLLLKKHKGTINKVSDENNTPMRGHFYYDKNDNIPLFYNNSIRLAEIRAGGNDFDKGLVWSFSNLKPNEERRIFVELKGGVDNHDLLNYVSTFEQTPTGVDSIIYALNFRASLANNFTKSTAKTPSSHSDQAEARIVGAHDPNYLDIYTCGCTADQRTYVADISFTNDGTIPTSYMNVEMEFPPQYDLSTLKMLTSDLNPIWNFEQTIKANTVTWIHDGLPKLRPHNPDDPSTMGHIKFSIQAHENINITDIEPMQACIRFINNERVNRECTESLHPRFIKQSEAAFTNFNCTICQNKYAHLYASILGLLGIGLVLGIALSFSKKKQ